MRIRMTIRGEEALRGLSLLFVRRIIRESCVRAFLKVFDANRTIIIDVACVSDAEIAELNGQYRSKPKPTDILSFGSFADTQSLVQNGDRTLDLGQIVLSAAFIARSATEDGVSWKREFTYVFSHGVLHLLGFDHEEEMFAIQDAVTEQLAPLAAESQTKTKKTSKNTTKNHA